MLPATLERRTSSKRTSLKATAAAPEKSLAPTMESFLILGSQTVMISPLVSVARTDEGSHQRSIAAG